MILVHNLIRIMILAGHQSFLTPKIIMIVMKLLDEKLSKRSHMKTGFMERFIRDPYGMIQKLMKELLVMNLLLLL